jgi:hypothetical protein
MDTSVQLSDLPDFLCVHDTYTSASTLMDPHWTLYCMDADYAYFVRLPLPVDAYQADTTNCFFVAQYTHAQHKLARMRVDDMLEWATQVGQLPRCVHTDTTCVQLPPFDHTSRCVLVSVTGGFAPQVLHLLRLLRNTPVAAHCFNDVDYFTSIAALRDARVWSDERTCQVLRAAMRVFRKNQVRV